MKLLWIGINYNDKMEAELLSYKAKILSGAVSQANLIAGIDANGWDTMDSINSYKYPAYPNGPFKVERKEWSRTGRSKDVSVSYLNVKYLNHVSRKNALKKEARRWAKALDPNEEVVVIVYAMHSPFLAAAKEIKRIHKKTSISLIILDLPQFMDMNMSRVKKVLKAMDWKKIRKYMRSVDKYILYSKHMAEFLGLTDGTWTVMEGSYDASLLVEDKDVDKDESKISVMYSGVLDLRYGIRELLDAFEDLDENYELWLTGNGNAVPLIKERAEKDGRIKFYGYLPSRYDLLKKQREATMLISTRDPSEQASAYCFPSKIFEYMVSGNPVISTEIKGISDEYFDYLVPLKTISPEEIAATVRGVAEMDKAEREALGKRGRAFILEQKNNVAQAKKMLDFAADRQ